MKGNSASEVHVVNHDPRGNIPPLERFAFLRQYQQRNARLRHPQQGLQGGPSIASSNAKSNAAAAIAVVPPLTPSSGIFPPRVELGEHYLVDTSNDPFPLHSDDVDGDRVNCARMKIRANISWRSFAATVAAI